MFSEVLKSLLKVRLGLYLSLQFVSFIQSILGFTK